MANKTSQGRKSVSNKVNIKFVKKAGMWVKTWFDEKGTQKQEWTSEKPKVTDETIQE